MQQDDDPGRTDLIEVMLRRYFDEALDRAAAGIPEVPGAALPPVPAGRPKKKADVPREGHQCYSSGVSTLLLAGCVLGASALAFSCVPRTALAGSIAAAIGDERLREFSRDVADTVQTVWQEGNKHFNGKSFYHRAAATP